jgi:hypothetical protein
MRRLALLVLAIFAVAPVLAEEIGDVFYFDASDPPPEAVMATTECDGAGDGGITRRPFAGGFVFAVRCPGNNANMIEALVFSETDDGSAPTLLTFPLPGPPEPEINPQGWLSNIRWHPETNELGEIFVDEEADDWCRSEARWRLDNVPPTATLVFFRHTRDCTGAGGWEVVVGTAEDQT